MQIIKLPPKIGAVVLVKEKRGYRLVKSDGSTLPIPLTESQGRILKKLNESPDGLIAAELSKKLSMTHAGVLYLLKPLIEKGIVIRTPLKGGGVLYYMKFDIIHEKLSPKLQMFRRKIEAETGKAIQELTAEELSEKVKDLPEEDRRALINWVLDGGWKKE